MTVWVDESIRDLDWALMVLDSIREDAAANPDIYETDPDVKARLHEVRLAHRRVKDRMRRDRQRRDDA